MRVIAPGTSAPGSLLAILEEGEGKELVNFTGSAGSDSMVNVDPPLVTCRINIERSFEEGCVLSSYM